MLIQAGQGRSVTVGDRSLDLVRFMRKAVVRCQPDGIGRSQRGVDAMSRRNGTVGP
jgi:hypothetical protein